MCVYVYVCICICICVHVYMYICVCMCMYVYVYVYMYGQYIPMSKNNLSHNFGINILDCYYFSEHNVTKAKLIA